MKSLQEKLEKDCIKKEAEKENDQIYQEYLSDDEESWNFEPAVPPKMKKLMSAIGWPVLLFLGWANVNSYTETRKLLIENNYNQEVVEQKIDEEYDKIPLMGGLLKGLKAPGRDIAYLVHAEETKE